MNTPKDEMFTTNEEDRERLRTRKTRLLRWAVVLFSAAGLVGLLWLMLAMVGCATQGGGTGVGTNRTAQWIESEWVKREVRATQEAQKGVVFEGTKK